MADIKPISDLAVASTVAAGDQFVINKAEGGSYKTSVIIPANLGPQLSDYIALGNLSDVNTANAAVDNVLKWDGSQWVPGTGGGGGSDYVLPVASVVTLGGVRIGDNINVDQAGNGIISVDNFVNADTGGTFKAGIAVEGSVSANSLGVLGNATVDGTLAMGGLVTFAAGQTFPGVSGDVDSVNGQTGTVLLDADDVGALPIDGSTEMTGNLQAQAISAKGNISTELNLTANGSLSAYTINGTELTIQDHSQLGGDLNVDGKLTAGSETTLSSTLGVTGKITGTTAEFSGQVTVPQTPGAATDAASKGYVDGLVINAGTGTVVSVAPGIGLTSSSTELGFTDGDPITTVGTLFVKAADDTISVTSTGIAVNITEVQNGLTFPVTSVNGQIGTVVLSAVDVGASPTGALPTSGGSMTGDITFTPDQPVMQNVTDNFLALSGGSLTGNLTMTGTSVINFSANQTFPTDLPPDATNNTKGVTFLSDSTSGTQNAATGTMAATPLAVSTTFAVATSASVTADAALPKSGGTMTGDITFNTGQTFPGAGAVDSVNGETGVVELSAADVDAVSLTTGGTFGGGITVEGDVTATTFYGDGSNLSGIVIPDAINFKGTTNCVTDAAPSSPVSGDLYLNLGTGDALASWTGLTSVVANQFVMYSVNSWNAGSVLDASTFVTLTSDQTITGTKTFTKQVTIPGTPVQNTDAASKGYTDTQISAIDFPVDSVNGDTGTVVVTAASIDALDLTDTNNQTMSGNLTMGGTSVIAFSANQTFPTDLPPDATNNTKGISFLSDAVDGTQNAATGTTAATPAAVTTVSTAAAAAQTTADAALPKAGGTVAGDLTVTGSTGLQAVTATTGSFSSTLGVTGASTLAATTVTTLGASGKITGTTGEFTGLVSGITPTEDDNFAIKSYVDTSIANIPDGGSVDSVNNVSPDSQGNVTIDAEDVNAWNSAGDTEFSTPCDVYTGALSGNALRIYGGLQASSPTLALRVMTGDGAEEIELSYPFEARAGGDFRDDLNFTQAGKHITFLDGQGNALEFAAALGDGTTQEYMRFNTGGTDQVMFFKKISAVSNEGIAFKELMPVGGSHINLTDSDADALDVVDESGNIYQRFNTAAEQIQFSKPVISTTVGSTNVNVTNINLANNQGSLVAGEINLVNNSNQALDITDEENNIYLRFRTTTNDFAVQVEQELRVASGTTVTTDGIVTVNKSVNIGVDADLEDGIILDTITDGGNQGGRIRAYVNQPSVGNKLNVFHVLNGDPDDAANNVNYIELKANGDATFAGEVTANSFVGDGSGLTGLAPVQISPTAPSTSVPGDLWWDSADGLLYVYYTDPGVEGDDTLESSSQWVDVRPGAGEIGDIVTALRALKSSAASATTLAGLKSAIATSLANI